MTSALAPSAVELAGLWEEIRDTLETETGMNLHDERQDRLAEAFRQFVHDNGLVSLTAIRQQLTDPACRGASIEQLVSHLTVGETFLLGHLYILNVDISFNTPRHIEMICDLRINCCAGWATRPSFSLA